MSRPKRQLDLTQEQLIHIISIYSEGASDVEVRAFIAKETGSCSLDLWKRWKEEEPEFKEAIEAGHLFSQAWWEKKGRKNIENKNFNATLWYMNMKNRFGWKDKQEHEIKPIDIKIDYV
jgi:hypothetical protein